MNSPPLSWDAGSRNPSTLAQPRPRRLDFPCTTFSVLIRTGKTSFIKYLLGQEYPGARIGPEPTTDRFNVVSYSGGPAANNSDDSFGSAPVVIPGNALVVDERMQFRAGLPDGYGKIFRLYVFGPLGYKDYGSATMRCKV